MSRLVADAARKRGVNKMKLFEEAAEYAGGGVEEPTEDYHVYMRRGAYPDYVENYCLDVLDNRLKPPPERAVNLLAADLESDAMQN